MSEIQIEFVKAPDGLTAVINSSGVVSLLQSAGAAIAGRAEGHYNVEIINEARGQDSRYGASRPVCIVSTADGETFSAESERKVLSSAVTG